MQIRPADLDDWEAILDIYNQAVRAGGASADLSPVTMAQRLRWFAEHGPDTYPIYIASDPDTKAIVGWCSLSPYRGGRLALRHVAEISYYIDYEHHGKGIAGQLIDHSLSECPRLQLEVLVAILLEVNQASIGLLLKRGFHRWGHLPNIARLGDQTTGHLIYGKHLISPMTLDKESAKRPSNAFLAGPFSPTSMLGPRTSAQPAKPWAPLEELADTMPNTSILAGTILSERLDSFY